MNEEETEFIEVPQKKQSHTRHTLRWQAYEFTYVRKPSEWYWKVGIITAGVTAAAYVLENYLFSILTVIGGFTFALFGAKKPDVLDMEISSKGVRIQTKLYPYSELKYFWILEDSPEPKILLQAAGMLHTHIVLPLGDADPEDVRTELLEHIEEKEMAEPITQRIIDRTGF